MCPIFLEEAIYTYSAALSAAPSPTFTHLHLPTQEAVEYSAFLRSLLDKLSHGAPPPFPFTPIPFTADLTQTMYIK